MNMNDVVVVDAAEQPRNLEDQTAKPYIAERKPPDVRISDNVDVVSAPFESFREVSNDRCNAAPHRRRLGRYHEDADRTRWCLRAGARTVDPPGTRLLDNRVSVLIDCRPPPYSHTHLASLVSRFAKGGGYGT